MDYNRIILEMLDRIKLLEDRVADLELQNSEMSDSKSNITTIKSKKYQPLTDYLCEINEPTVTLTFEAIEQILGFGLPNSARIHRAYWSNTKTHSVSLSWLNAGFETVDVDLNHQEITFRRGMPDWRGSDMSIDMIWNKISAHAGEVFSTKTGVNFTYRMVGDQAIQTSQTDWLLNKSNFLKAMRLMPVKGPGGYGQQIMGPSYVYALLTDPRIIAE